MRVRLALLAMLLASPAYAHHSGAMFDREKTVSLSGTIKAYEFTQPHTWIRIMVPTSDGGEDEWAIEGNAPQNMRARGFVPSELHPGQKVTVRAHPLRDGRKGASIIDLTFADGRVLTTIGAKGPSAP